MPGKKSRGKICAPFGVCRFAQPCLGFRKIAGYRENFRVHLSLMRRLSAQFRNPVESPGLRFTRTENVPKLSFPCFSFGSQPSERSGKAGRVKISGEGGHFAVELAGLVVASQS